MAPTSYEVEVVSTEGMRNREASGRMSADAAERVRQLARAYYGIEFTAARAAEIAAELERLESTTRDGLGAIDFDSDPNASFRRVLYALAAEALP